MDVTWQVVGKFVGFQGKVANTERLFPAAKAISITVATLSHY
jgi:hypothetical protein